MKTLLLALALLSSLAAHAEPVTVVDGRFYFNPHCESDFDSAFKSNAVSGEVFGSGKAFDACALGLGALTEEQFGSGVPVDALGDGNIYRIQGTLKGKRILVLRVDIPVRAL
jgi:hypothetical protein